MTEILIKKKNIILDATVFTTFMGCARLTDFRFNMDLVSLEGKSSSIEMGSIAHSILEFYYKAKRDGLSTTDAQSAGFAAGREYISGYAPDNVYIKDESELGVKNVEDKDIELVFTTIQQYFEHYKNDFWIPVFVEHVKQDIIYEDDEIRIMWKAKLDLAVDTNNGIYPVDHKTMKQRRDSVSLNNQFMGQCLLMKTRGVIINKIGFQTSLKPSEKFTRPILSYSLNQLTEWSQVIVPFWAKQMLVFDEIAYWPPNYTHCENKYEFCAFKSVCEAPPNMREEEIRLHFIKGKKWDVHND